MCGIAGLVGPGSFDRLLTAKKIADALNHRGPDGRGEWTTPEVSLHHRRLAIFDTTEAGAQPMKRDGLVIVFNGAVYNWRQLRADIGGEWRSNTDTEVIVRAWAKWGPSCVRRFDGMFAFVIHDTASRRTWAARDRLGIKPLYVAHMRTPDGQTWAFASEPQALAKAGLASGVNERAIAEYLTTQNVWSGETFWSGITEFPAASVGEFTDAGLSVTQWWSPVWTREIADAATATDETLQVVAAAVASQGAADVPVGAYLSGGIDSGAIVALSRPSMPTFTVGWVESIIGAADERDAAMQVAAATTAEHYDVVLAAGHLHRVVPRVFEHVDVPRCGQPYPDMAAAELASKYVKVALSGTGADELFGGYPWRITAYAAWMEQSFRSYWTRRFGWDGGLAEFMHRSQREHVNDVAVSVIERARSSSDDNVHRGMTAELYTFLPGLLTVCDRISMANGIEARVPFLANGVVDLALRLAPGLLNGVLSKPILRAAMHGWLPDGTLKAAKQGFSAPDEQWFRGEARPFVLGQLNDKAPLWSIVDRGKSMEVVDRHIRGASNFRLAVWSLIAVNGWLRLHAC